MSASTSGFQGPGSWKWPDDVPDITPSADGGRPTTTHPKQRSNATSGPAASGRFWSYVPFSRKANSAASPSAGPTSSQAGPTPPPQRHYKPRTCRICLETVLPTVHAPSEHLPNVLAGRPYVTYDSEEGRLISPCKCKGSSRYVHETCLQEWRHADPAYGRRNYWQCPTCSFRYRLERMQWGHWLSSRATQLALTLFIFIGTIFLLGFVADPIINMYLDPVNTVTSVPLSRGDFDHDSYYDDDGAGWYEHFVKGFASLGVLGCVKVLFTLTPFQFLQYRTSSSFFNSRGATTGRDRVNNISWIVVIFGVCTFLYVSQRISRFSNAKSC